MIRFTEQITTEEYMELRRKVGWMEFPAEEAAACVQNALLVDCDPQGSLTISLGHPQPDTLPVTLADQMPAVLNDSPIDPGGILHHDEGVDLLPANISLAGMEVSLVNAMSRETTLKRVLANYSKDYDVICRFRYLSCCKKPTVQI